MKQTLSCRSSPNDSSDAFAFGECKAPWLVSKMLRWQAIEIRFALHDVSKRLVCELILAQEQN
jgi:hypothetical protein